MQFMFYEGGENTKNVLYSELCRIYLFKFGVLL